MLLLILRKTNSVAIRKPSELRQCRQNLGLLEIYYRHYLYTHQYYKKPEKCDSATLCFQVIYNRYTAIYTRNFKRTDAVKDIQHLLRVSHMRSRIHDSMCRDVPCSIRAQPNDLQMRVYTLEPVIRAAAAANELVVIQRLYHAASSSCSRVHLSIFPREYELAHNNLHADAASETASAIERGLRRYTYVAVFI